MDGLQPVSNLSPSELPDGFTLADPHGSAVSKQQGQNAQEEQMKALLEQALTPEALARLRRIKLVKPGEIGKLENVIMQMAISGKLQGPINEGKLIEMLERRSAATEKSGEAKISIQRKRYTFDSEEEDNDDDL